MVLGLILLTAYVVLYGLIVREFRLLKGEFMKTAFFRVCIYFIILYIFQMNLFFILMLIIMLSRTVYYLVMHFNIEKGLYDKPLDNNYLVGIYFEELIFNFIVFYNLILKENNQNKHFEP